MSRSYDLVVYGATGYLGSLVVQYLWAHGPPALRWAVAGRSGQKLATLVNSLDRKTADRNLPDTMVTTLAEGDLGRMASQTSLVLNTVGIIPQCAVESSPPDLMTLLMARTLQRPLGPMFFTIQHSWTGFSGGTIASIFAGLETYSLRQMMAAGAPGASCISDAGPHRPHSAPMLPVRRDRFLGDVTFNPSAMADQNVVMRTWSLLNRYGEKNEQYGTRFSFQGYTAADSRLGAWSSFLTMSVAILCTVLFPPFRWLLQWLSPEPGTGPQLNSGEKHFVEWKATVAADGTDVHEPSALGVMRMDTDVYSVCATFVSEAALTFLLVLTGKSEDSLAEKLGGGILTPASLGITYVERLEKAGLHWTVTEVKS
ncbi:hypothetical protein N7456_000408 [Penicillium angulare]|uniref:Saccharopine dehydrogenase NADP binding domain-containing protein n=1 Tax=Penicillium angulare TaxID=116970 RepID=A0A9W9KS35_9EURO|nr:hypothetical protein N7456_000408 [Penicillium angulare]